MNLITIATILVFVFGLLSQAIKILKEYERGGVFFLGRFQRVKGPGLIILIPGLEKMIRVDLRTVTMDIPSQDIISKDNVTLKVKGVVYFPNEDNTNQYRVPYLVVYFHTLTIEVSGA